MDNVCFYGQLFQIMYLLITAEFNRNTGTTVVQYRHTTVFLFSGHRRSSHFIKFMKWEESGGGHTE